MGRAFVKANEFNATCVGPAANASMTGRTPPWLGYGLRQNWSQASLTSAPRGLEFARQGAPLGRLMPALFAGSVVWRIRMKTGRPPLLKDVRSPWKGMKCVWARTFPPSESEGWTVQFIERETRYWVDAYAGRKDASLFEQCTATVWTWASPAQFIRWFNVRVACCRLRGTTVWSRPKFPSLHWA